MTNAAKATTQAVGKGVRAVGKRAEETKDAFSGFKEEYDKARGAKGSDGGTSTVVKKASSAKPSSKTASAKKAPAKKNMFAAFKEEYDKARHGDE